MVFYLLNTVKDTDLMAIYFFDFFADLTSTEILDAGSSTWRPGPDFPVGTYGSTAITDSNGAFYMVRESLHLQFFTVKSFLHGSCIFQALELIFYFILIPN
jgi:hypothetical protein